MSRKKNLKNCLQSTWTPLGNEETNNQMFEERRVLILKWFDKWTDEQRRTLLDDLIGRCRPKQLDYVNAMVKARTPVLHVDFTRALPRVLTLYIFSFLDPRSLCRAAQVCWYWKNLTEANELWMPKCARLGWYVNGPIGSTAPDAWKKHYIENIEYLQITRPAKELAAIEIAKQLEEAERQARLLAAAERPPSGAGRSRKPIPWRGPDPRPVDTRRCNYLDNGDMTDRGRTRNTQKTNQGRPSSGTRRTHSAHRRSGSASGHVETMDGRTSLHETFPVSSTRGSATEFRRGSLGQSLPLDSSHLQPPNYQSDLRSPLSPVGQLTANRKPASLGFHSDAGRIEDVYHQQPPTYIKRPSSAAKITHPSRKRSPGRNLDDDGVLPPGKPWITSNIANENGE